MRKKPIKHLELKTHWARRICCLFYFATLISFSAEFLVQHDRAQIWTWIVWGICLTPLLAFLPGLIMGSPRNQVILCFFLLLYFCFSVMSSFAPALLGQLSLSTALAESGLFISAMYYARWQARRNWLQQQEISARH